MNLTSPHFFTVLALSMIPFLFSGGLINVFFVLFLCGFLFQHRANIPSFRALKSNALVLIWATLMAVIIMSATWSIIPEKTAEKSIKIVVFTGLGLLSSLVLFSLKAEGKKPDINPKVIFGSMIALSMIMIFEHLTHYKMSYFFKTALGFDTDGTLQPLDRATALYTMLLPFLLTIFRVNKVALFTLIAVTLVTYLLHPMFAATASLFAALLAMIAVYLLGRIVVKAFFAGAMICVLGAPYIFSFVIGSLDAGFRAGLPPTWASRINIWERSTSLIEQKPFLGWGIKTANDIESTIPGLEKVMELHPHNIPLQIHLEIGLLGAAIVTALLCVIYRRVNAIQDTHTLACIMGALSAYMVFASVSFGAWQTWWLSSTFLIIFVATVFCKQSEVS